MGVGNRNGNGNETAGRFCYHFMAIPSSGLQHGRKDEKWENGMNEEKQGQASPYTCNDYRQEMILLAMRRKLQDGGLAENERRRLHEEIARLEKRMGMD